MSDLFDRREADISECGQYRYSLLRVWDRRCEALPIIMLNPSTADAAIDDPTIVWEFCHTAPVPRMIELIEDRDLWRWRFDDAKPFGLWLRSEPMAFQRWTEIAEQLSADPREMMLEARAMQRFFDQKVRELVSMARMIRRGGHDVPAANVPPMFASDVGNALLAVHPDAPFAACYSDQGKQRGFSLRSEDSRTDVSAIAKRYGGGGHRNAAGFEMPIV